MWEQERSGKPFRVEVLEDKRDQMLLSDACDMARKLRRIDAEYGGLDVGLADLPETPQVRQARALLHESHQLIRQPSAPSRVVVVKEVR